MNGKCFLINRKGTKFKFYWAPLSPAPTPSAGFEQWGVAVVDLSWPIEDPRPLHLRAKPLPYSLKPPVQILRDPHIPGFEDEDFRSQVLGYHMYQAIQVFSQNKSYYSWASG